MTDIDYPEEFVPIAAELQRLPYLSPSPKFADRVMARVHRASVAAPAEVTVADRPRLDVVRGGKSATAVSYAPDASLVKSRRRTLLKVGVGIPVAAGVVIGVAILFAQLDVLAVLLSAAAVQLGAVIGVIGQSLGDLVLGSGAMSTLESGAAESALLYIVIAIGLIAGYSGIRLSAEIARRKAA